MFAAKESGTKWKPSQVEMLFGDGARLFCDIYIWCVCVCVVVVTRLWCMCEYIYYMCIYGLLVN